MAIKFKINPTTGLLDAVSDIPGGTYAVFTVKLSNIYLFADNNYLYTGFPKYPVEEITIFDLPTTGNEVYEANLINVDVPTGWININMGVQMTNAKISLLFSKQRSTESHLGDVAWEAHTVVGLVTPVVQTCTTNAVAITVTTLTASTLTLRYNDGVVGPIDTSFLNVSLGIHYYFFDGILWREKL